MRIKLPKKSVTTNKRVEEGVSTRTQEVKPTTADRAQPQPVAKHVSTNTPTPTAADLPSHVAKLEHDIKDLRKFLGLQGVQTDTMGVCRQDGLTGKVVREDAFSSRKYVFYKDAEGHEWFDEVPLEA